MCGIVGAWERTPGDPKERSERVCAALGTLRHRGPDDEGVWVDPGAGLVLGHRRLSIIDVSASGHQPMVSQDGRYVLTYNGELYNYRELREELESAGVRFVSTSDTEVVLEGFARWGEGLLQRMVGMFAFAVWDGAEQRLLLARDRAGEKPLYYATGPSAFAFASELPALRGLPWLDSGIDPEAVALYLEHQYVPAPLTIYRGARKLPPAHAMTVDAGGLRTWRYWDPLELALEPAEPLGEEEAVEQLEALLGRAVRQQMVSDVPLGAFLSGGIDSSAVVAMMVEASSAPVRTFTIGFEEEALDEAPHAQRVADFLGTDHTAEILSGADALERVPSIPATYGEPFADASSLPTRLVSEVARKHVTVSLSGDGGDELFGGYARYDRFERLLELTSALGPFRGAARRLLRGAPGKLGTFAGLLDSTARTDPYHSFVSVFRRSQAEALTGRASPGYPAYERVWSATGALPPRRRAMTADFHTYLPEAILTKVDRASMAVSLESRAPFLDHRLVEWSLRLPPELVHRKRVLKSFLYRKVPRELLERPKMGFGVPLASWFRKELKTLVFDMLEPARLASVGVTGHAEVERVLAEHMSGKQNHDARLWALLVLSLWKEQDAR